MTIQEIKENLGIKEVLAYYDLQPKNGMICCPFHEDQTPSMQVFEDSNSVRCYSGNCARSGRVIDVIDFVMFKENLSKAEAIRKAKEFTNIDFRITNSSNLEVRSTNNQQTSIKNLKSKEYQELPKERFEEIFYKMKSNIKQSKAAKEYAEIRNLNVENLEIGYNGRTYKGLMNCLVFPMKDKNNKIVSLYGRSIKDLRITNNDLGITNEELGITNNDLRITNKDLGITNEEIGITKQENRQSEIENKKSSRHFYLKDRNGLYPGYPQKETQVLILTESIIDAASLLQITDLGLTNIKESKIDNQKSPIVNILACYGTNGFTEEHRQAIQELPQLEEIIFMFDMDEAGQKAVEQVRSKILELQKDNTLKSEISNLKFSQVELPSKDVNEVLQLHEANIFTELLTNRIIVNSEELTIDREKLSPVHYSLSAINELIGKSGIIGEENTRLLLFIIAGSYKTRSPLHGIVQGSSGSGKTHLISKIADLMPPEDVLRFTRITESSLYNWGEWDLVNKLLIIEDLDGLKEEALYALRELISNQRLSSSISIKDKKGNIKSTTKKVQGIFASMSATTKGDIYEDNISRSFILAVDESTLQSRKIIHYQNQKYAGEIKREEENQAKKELQNYMRNLQNVEVINPYATKLELPKEVHKIRRLNQMYQSIIRQITYLNQRQRRFKNGCIYTEIEDLEQATQILFESIILKIDELDGSLRQFYERLKKYLKTKDKEFYLREVRQSLNISKTQMFRYIQTLKELDYIKAIGGHERTGIKYKILYWDDHQKLRQKIKEQLHYQINQLKTNTL